MDERLAILPDDRVVDLDARRRQKTAVIEDAEVAEEAVLIFDVDWKVGPESPGLSWTVWQRLVEQPDGTTKLVSLAVPPVDGIAPVPRRKGGFRADYVCW